MLGSYSRAMPVSSVIGAQKSRLSEKQLTDPNSAARIGPAMSSLQPSSSWLWLLFLVMLSQMVTSVSGVIVTGNQFKSCSPNPPALTTSSFDYMYDTGSRLFHYSIAGSNNNANLKGWNTERNAVVQLVVTTFGDDESIASIGDFADVFNLTQNQALKTGHWQLSNSRTLALPPPWIDFNVTFRIQSEVRGEYYTCVTVTVTQQKAEYLPVPGLFSAALPPLALFAGLADNFVGPNSGLIPFLLGDGTANRIPGVFDMWEHAQWVAMTGMIGINYPDMYTRFISYFGWSMLNWRLRFVTKLANGRLADPDMKKGPQKTQPQGQTLPACSSTNAGPKGVCSKAGECCNQWGYCGTGADYCNTFGSKPFDPAAVDTPAGAPAVPNTGAANDDNTKDAINVADPSDLLVSADPIGVTAYAYSIDIRPHRLANDVFYTFVIVMIVFVILSALFIGIFFLIKRQRGVSGKAWPDIQTVLDLIVGIIFRIALLAFLPLTLVVIYHLALPATRQYGPGTLALCSLVLMVLVSAPIYLLYLIYSCHSPTALFDVPAYLRRLGPLYNTYRYDRVRYASIWVARRFIYAIIIGAGQPSAVTQVVCLIVLEASLMIAELWFLPRPIERGNRLAIITCIIRIIGWLMLIPMLPTIHLEDGYVQATAFAIIIYHLFVILLLFLMIAYSLFRSLVSLRSHRIERPMSMGPTDHRPVPSNVLPPSGKMEGGGLVHSDTYDRYQAPLTNERINQPKRNSGAGSFALGLEPRTDSPDSFHHGNIRRYSGAHSSGSPGLNQFYSDAEFLREARRPAQLNDGSNTPVSSGFYPYHDSRTPDTDGTVGTSESPTADRIIGHDGLFYYGGDDPDLGGGHLGSPSANQPRLIPAFLRQHDVSESSGSETGSPATDTFPRYMMRASTPETPNSYTGGGA